MTTTIDDALPGETEALVAEVAAEAVVPPTRRPRIWLRLFTGFVLGLVLVVALSGAALFAADASYEGRVLPGVRVGEMDLSGMDRDQAAATLKAAYASYGAGRLIVRTTAGDVIVPYADIARAAHVDEMVDAALATGRDGTALERAIGEVRLATGGRTLEPWLTIDEAALKAKVEAGLAGLERPPVDSTIAMDPTSITLTLGRTGRAFDGTAAIAAATDALRRTDAPDELVVEADSLTTQPAIGVLDTLAAKYAAERMARPVVVTRGKTKWTIKAAVVRSWIHFETQADGSPWPVVDATAIAKALTPVAKAVKLPAVSASYLKARNGKVVGVTPDKPGHALDSAAMAAAIAKVVEDRAGWVDGANVKVRLTPVAPKLTTEQASRTAPVMQILGTWKTWFPVNDHNFFGANIWIPARIIDGTVLRPGQRFEWWSAVGPVNPSRGFGPGGFIAGDHTEPTGALGGGMCSSSTTLFNAACARASRWAPARITSTTSTATRSASMRRCPRRAAAEPDHVVHQRHEDLDRHPHLPIYRGRPRLGPLRDLGHPGRAHSEPQQAVRLERPAGDDLDGLRRTRSSPASGCRPSSRPTGWTSRCRGSCARAAG